MAYLFVIISINWVVYSDIYDAYKNRIYSAGKVTLYELCRCEFIRTR